MIDNRHNLVLRFNESTVCGGYFSILSELGSSSLVRIMHTRPNTQVLRKVVFAFAFEMTPKLFACNHLKVRLEE